jgi:protein-disulfide isomerase
MNEQMRRNARWLTIAAATIFFACSSAPPNAEKKDDTAAPADAPAAAAPAGGAASAGLDKDKIGTQIKRYFESQGQIPADVEVTVADLKPSEVSGLNEGSLKLSRGEQAQELKFLVSNDGRWFLRVDPIDLNVDPVEAVIAKIDLGEDQPSRGPKDAKVTIVEYSDFQCPFCAKAETIVQEEVLKEYGDKVRFVYKQFPLTSIHPWAESASLIGLCVFKQVGNDAYWKYHAKVFANASEVPADAPTDKLVAFATEAGGDEAKIKECLEKEETQEIVDATLEEAESIGVNSTPTFFVNGRRLSGAQPLDAFKGLIEPELQKGS